VRNQEKASGRTIPTAVLFTRTSAALTPTSRCPAGPSAPASRPPSTSSMIRGIGPVYAKKMVKSFGEKVFDIIEAEPGRLREVTGIGAVRAKRITDAWAEQKIVREIMVFLHSHGVGTARAVRIFKTYGADAVQVMTENPYRLARDIRGIGFKSADAIAMRLGIEKTAMIRLRAGISYALTEAMDEGHCGLPTDQLIPLAEKLLEAPRELILTALELERSEGAVIADRVGDTACTFLAGLYRAEQAIAERLIRIVSGRLPWEWIDEEKALPWVEKRSGLQLADSQRTAIRLALMAKALVITGGPGVGKTTIVNSILKILAAKGVRLLLCAPTGRAAKRMTEATGVEAKTIHRLLEVDPKSGGFKRNADNSLECDLLVVDEASMVDVMLMQALVKAISDKVALLIVGDIDQLPSVGPGQVLADIIGSGAVPVVRLTEVFRQAAASRIIINAHRINQGAMPGLSAPAGDSDFCFVPADDPETAVLRIVELVKTRIPKRFGLNSIRRCHGALGLRSGPWPNNRADEENQLRRIPVPARDYSPGDLALCEDGVAAARRGYGLIVDEQLFAAEEGAGASRENVVLSCSVGNRRRSRGLPGGAEGIRNDGHRNFRPVEEHGRHVLTVLGCLEAKPTDG
jgi:exodeoxyribonuclease V alpha subunit